MSRRNHSKDMNDEYEERGFFKQLVLVLFATYVWCSIRVERSWQSERFWWCVSVAFAIVALICLKCVVVK